MGTFSEVREERADREEGACDICHKNALPGGVVMGRVGKGAEAVKDAGIAYDDVDGGSLNVTCKGVGGAFIGDVEGVGGECFRKLLEERSKAGGGLGVSSGGNHSVAAGEVGRGEGEAEATVGAGDENGRHNV